MSSSILRRNIVREIAYDIDFIAVSSRLYVRGGRENIFKFRLQEIPWLKGVEKLRKPVPEFIYGFRINLAKLEIDPLVHQEKLGQNSRSGAYFQHINPAFNRWAFVQSGFGNQQRIHYLYGNILIAEEMLPQGLFCPYSLISRTRRLPLM